jgi:hypothetical protein
MSTPKVQALGIIQDSFTKCWKATGEVEGVGWLEVWGSTSVEAREALQAKAGRVATERRPQEENS